MLKSEVTFDIIGLLKRTTKSETRVEYNFKQQKPKVPHTNLFAHVEWDDWLWVRYPIDVKSAGFRSLLEASRVSSHPEGAFGGVMVSKLD